MCIKKVAIVIATLMLFVGLLVYMFLSYANKLAKSSSACVNMKVIGCCASIYLHENKDSLLPDTIREFIDEHDYSDAAFCPFCRKQYVYFGKGIKADMPGNIILAISDCPGI